MSDANVERVREKLKQRAEAGLKKYGVTTERNDLSFKQWLIHAQEEALDFAVYLERIIADLPSDSASEPLSPLPSECSDHKQPPESRSEHSS